MRFLSMTFSLFLLPSSFFLSDCVGKCGVLMYREVMIYYAPSNRLRRLVRHIRL